MELKEYFPMWDKLTDLQQSSLLSAADERKYKKGQIVHNGLFQFIHISIYSVFNL